MEEVYLAVARSKQIEYNRIQHLHTDKSEKGLEKNVSQS